MKNHVVRQFDFPLVQAQKACDWCHLIIVNVKGYVCTFWQQWKGGENCKEDQNQGNSFLELFVSGAKAKGLGNVLSPENFIFLNEDFSTLRKVIYFT